MKRFRLEQRVFLNSEILEGTCLSSKALKRFLEYKITDFYPYTSLQYSYFFWVPRWPLPRNSFIMMMSSNLEMLEIFK